MWTISGKPTAFECSSTNYSLLWFYNVQNKFIDVSTERAVFIFRVNRKPTPKPSTLISVYSNLSTDSPGKYLDSH
jgi:hypothetical protein